MNANQKLQIVNGETNPQKRLKLLVDHGFVAEASQLIRDMVHTHTPLFHYDWHDREFSRPLPRVTDEGSAVYVIVTSSSKLDYHPYPHNHEPGDKHIVFELGWEREALGWTEEESRQLVRTILAHALARPISQWSFKQAEGTGRASRQLLSADDSMAREVAALHLVYQLREADFGHICNYLADIEGFPFAGGGWSKKLDEEGIVNWIVEKLLDFGWTHDRIQKELVEWMWLKTGTWPQWLLAVAKAKIFADNDQVRAAAIRRWIGQGFDYLLNTVPRRADKKEMAETYRQLFRIGQFGTADEGWICDKLVAQMASGKASSVKWFFDQFAETLGFDELSQVRDRAIEVAEKAGNYGTAVALVEFGEEVPDEAWVEIVKIRGLSTKLE